MADPRELLKALSEPFPPQAIEKREGGGGKMLDYVATETVIRRLNNTVGVWDFRITDTKIMPAGDSQLLVTWGEMTIPGLGTRAGTGVQMLHPRGGEDMWKGAASDCLKKCATLFGVGIDLYGPDLEAGEIRQLNNVPQRARNTSQNTVAPQQQSRGIDLANLGTPTPINQQAQPNGNQAPQARAGLEPTPKQFSMIGGIRDRMGWTDDDLHTFAGVNSLNDLDRKEVSELIDALMQKERSGDFSTPDDAAEKNGGGSFDDVPF